MSEEQMKKEDQLFIHLVNTFVQSAWISLGKVKSPVSDTLERNLEQATYYIDLLDMLQTKMKGNLSEWEEQYIIHSLSELKLNFIDEQKKGDQENNSKEEKVDDAIDKNKVSKKIHTNFILKSALFIGIFQVLALIPGVSRAGITITASRILGFDRIESAKIAFYLSIPALTAVSIFGIYNLSKESFEFNILALLGIVLSFLFSLITSLKNLIEYSTNLSKIGKFSSLIFGLYFFTNFHRRSFVFALLVSTRFKSIENVIIISSFGTFPL